MDGFECFCRPSPGNNSSITLIKQSVHPHTPMHAHTHARARMRASECDITSERYHSCVAAYVGSYLLTIQILYGRGHGPLVTAELSTAITI